MSALPDPWKSLAARIYKIEESIKRLQNSSPFSGTGLSIPEAGTTQVDGNLWVTGNFTADGKISNDALTSPVLPGVFNQVVTNFAVSASWVSIVSATATVPVGFSQMLVHITGMAFVVNPNTTGGSNGAGADVVEARATAGGVTGMVAGVAINGNNGQTSVPCAVATLLTGLTGGGTVTLTVDVKAGYQSFGAANGANQTNLCATLLWLR